MTRPSERSRRAAWGRRLLLAVADLPGARRLGERFPRLLVLAHAALGAFAVRRPAVLLVRWAAGRSATGSYRLRGSGVRVRVRHTLGDVWVLDEVFNRGVYTPPSEVERALTALGRPLRIVDLGAHIGAVSLDYLDRYPGCSVVAFEPNGESRTLLEDNVAANGLAPRVEIVAAAAGVAPGVVQLAGSSVLSHVVRAGDDRPPEHLGAFAAEFGGEGAVEVTLVDVLPHLAGADLLKLDIEGGEWDILADPRFAALDLTALVLEFHQLGAPEDDARAAVLRALAAAGFTPGEPFDERNGEGVVWAHRAPAAIGR